MSVNVTIAGTTYPYPTEGEEGWGSVTTNWAIAVSSQLLQRTGGSFSLTAEVDFGATFATKQAYLKSRTSNPASAGMVRLARADVVSWRNQANGANLDLGVDSSNRLTWNGNVIIPSSGVIQPTEGGTGISSYTTGDTLYASASNVLSKLAIGTQNYVYTAGATIPAWALLVNANIDASAAIARTKLASGTVSVLLANSGAGVMSELTVTGSGGALAAIESMTTTGTNPAGTGVFRMANAEALAWRNAANTNNRTLSVDSGNFLTYTGASAGNEAVIAATNADNTNTASNARFRAGVGGASGGDAYFDAVVTGVTSWAAGLDNSDSDAFVISNGAPGTNNALRFSTGSAPDGSLYGNLLMRGQKELRLGDSDSSNYVALKSPATVGTNYTVTVPDTAPANNTFLKHTTSGTYSWAGGSAGLISSSKSSGFTLDAAVDVYECDSTGGTFAVTVPAAGTNTGKSWQVTKTNSGFTAITFATGLVSSINTQGETLTIYDDGSSIIILSRYIPSTWVAYTPTGGWSSNTTYVGAWRRVGDSMECAISVAVSGGPPTSANLTIDLPSGVTIDTAKLPGFSSAITVMGNAIMEDNGSSDYIGTVSYQSTTSILVRGSAAGIAGAVTQAAPFAFNTGDFVTCRFSAPISTWK